MLKDIINQMQANSLRPKEEIAIEDVFKTICESLTANKEILDKSLIYENGQEIDIVSLQKIFVKSSLNCYGNTSSPFINDYGRVSENMAPYGVIGLQVNRRISLNNYCEIVKVCLETRNSLVMKPFIKSQTLEIIIQLINDVLKQTVDFNEIILTDVNLENEDVDLLIYVGEKSLFNKLNFKKEKIFLGIGQYELFVDEVIDEKMLDFAKANGIKIFYDHENVFDEINEVGANYCTAIMSGNKEKIREFITKVKSSYILVNMSPTLVDNANIYPEQLLKRKTTVIYE